MRCDVCDNGDRRPERRPYVEQREDRIAVVTGVPVEECPACGEVWFVEGVALRLDQLLTDMIANDVVAIRPYDEATPSAA
ncbi:MAG: YgiT-type zinc finger protein [Acidimicrobiia bacterium]